MRWSLPSWRIHPCGPSEGRNDQVAALDLLIGELGESPVFLSGISFGGLMALHSKPVGKPN
jgi:hypothetical protein